MLDNYNTCFIINGLHLEELEHGIIVDFILNIIKIKPYSKVDICVGFKGRLRINFGISTEFSKINDLNSISKRFKENINVISFL